MLCSNREYKIFMEHKNKCMNHVYLYQLVLDYQRDKNILNFFGFIVIKLKQYFSQIRKNTRLIFNRYL